MRWLLVVSGEISSEIETTSRLGGREAHGAVARQRALGHYYEGEDRGGLAHCQTVCHAHGSKARARLIGRSREDRTSEEPTAPPMGTWVLRPPKDAKKLSPELDVAAACT